MNDIAADLLHAGLDSTSALRAEITDVRLGPIEQDRDTILYSFRGEQRKALIPRHLREHLIGFNPEADRAVALSAMLEEMGGGK